MSWRWGVALVAAGGAAAGTVLWAGGERTFVTHPVSVLALGAAAVAVTELARRADAGVRPMVLALAGAVAAYLVLGGWATTAPASLSAGLWSAGWIPVTALLAAIGLTAAGLRRVTWALLVLSAAVTVAGALLVRPVAPFRGIATVAPEGWQQAAPLFVDAALGVWHLALVTATVVVFLVATRASIVDRDGWPAPQPSRPPRRAWSSPATRWRCSATPARWTRRRGAWPTPARSPCSRCWPPGG